MAERRNPFLYADKACIGECRIVYLPLVPSGCCTDCADILEFFCLTPLPGSEDHKKLHAAGVDLDPDLNKYDLEHACTDHPRMSRQRWTEVYKDAFARYYTDEHVEKIMRRAVAGGLQTSSSSPIGDLLKLRAHRGCAPAAIWRRSAQIACPAALRDAARSSADLLSLRAYDFSTAMAKWGLIFWRYYRMMKRIKKNPAAKSYSDEAMRLPSGSTKPTRSSNCSPIGSRTPMAPGTRGRSGASHVILIRSRNAL